MFSLQSPYTPANCFQETQILSNIDYINVQISHCKSLKNCKNVSLRSFRVCLIVA